MPIDAMDLWRGQEMAPQIRTLIPWSLSWVARLAGSVDQVLIIVRLCAVVPSVSRTSSWSAASKTVDILSLNVDRAIFIVRPAARDCFLW